MGRYHYVFPRWSNSLLPVLGATAAVLPLYALFIVAYGFSPKTTDAGYQPIQPVPYSHELHAGQLGIDCRYCHNTVETADKAAIPPTQTCMNCHTQIHKDSPKLVPIKTSYQTGMPVLWSRVHDEPDFVYFSHAAHVTRGVSCVECHGRVDKMVEVIQAEPLNMGWCLECHRHPETRVRDPKDVTDLGKLFEADDTTRREIAGTWIARNQLAPSQDCSTCHR